MERQYRFAGVELVVSIPDTVSYTDSNLLEPFSVSRTADPHRFCFEIVDTLDPPAGRCIVTDPGFLIYEDADRHMRYIGTVSRSWENAYIRTDVRGRAHHVQVTAHHHRGRIGGKTVLNALEAEHLVARAGGFIFHCAYIERRGRAILFTAPSGTGKSTQAELWKDLRGAQIINGDRAAVRMEDGVAVAEGIPFAGSSPYCGNRSLPIEAIVYLGQAPATTIRRMKGYEAFARIWEGVSVNAWDKTDVELVSAAVQRIAQSVPIYHMPCTPDETAVNVLEQALESR